MCISALHFYQNVGGSYYSTLDILKHQELRYINQEYLTSKYYSVNKELEPRHPVTNF